MAHSCGEDPGRRCPHPPCSQMPANRKRGPCLQPPALRRDDNGTRELEGRTAAHDEDKAAKTASSNLAGTRSSRRIAPGSRNIVHLKQKPSASSAPTWRRYLHADSAGHVIVTALRRLVRGGQVLTPSASTPHHARRGKAALDRSQASNPSTCATERKIADVVRPRSAQILDTLPSGCVDLPKRFRLCARKISPEKGAHLRSPFLLPDAVHASRNCGR